MRRLVLLLTTMAAVLLVASGVALAVVRIGGPGPDVLRGTDGRDRLEGGRGPDALFGLGARDLMVGGPGRRDPKRRARRRRRRRGGRG